MDGIKFMIPTFTMILGIIYSNKDLKDLTSIKRRLLVIFYILSITSLWGIWFSCLLDEGDMFNICVGIIFIVCYSIEAFRVSKEKYRSEILLLEDDYDSD